MFLESAQSLLHQFTAISEEKNALDTLLPLKQFNQGYRNPGLASAGGENHEESAAGGFDALSDGLDRFDLISAVDNPGQGHFAGERFSEPVEMRKSDEILLVEKSTDLAWGVEFSVPEPDFVAVGKKHEGISAVLITQGIGVIRCLSFTFKRIPARPFGFNNGKQTAQTIIEGIINKFVASAVSTCCRATWPSN